MPVPNQISLRSVVEVYLYACLVVCKVLPLTKTDVARLDYVLDSAVFRIFGCSSSADISYISAAVDMSCVTGYTWHTDIGIFRDDILQVFRGPLWCGIVLAVSISTSFFFSFLFS